MGYTAYSPTTERNRSCIFWSHMINIKATLDLSNSKNRCQIKPSDAFAVYFIQYKAEGISESVIPELNKNQISVQKRN
jgi:hypothetical protein